jgi:hypothetical protein
MSRRLWIQTGSSLALAACFLLAQSSAFAEQPNDVKVIVKKGEKSPTVGAADVLIVNDTGAVLPVELGETKVNVPIGKELPLKVERGLDPLSITEYRWGIRGKAPKTTMGWIPRKIMKYDSRLGVKGGPKKHKVTRPQ